MDKIKKYKINQILVVILGALLYSIGVNLFVASIGLYSGGFVGISQIIRTVLIEFLGLPLTNIDVAGLIYFILNVPVLILAYKSLGRSFFVKTIVCIISQTIFLTLIRSPQQPIITDSLTSCIIGGLLAGAGAGIPLRLGASGGGTDTIGVYMTKKYKNFSVGKLSLIVNVAVYLICALLFELSVAIYSIIFAAVVSTVIDRIHLQNISMMALVCTKKDAKTMSNVIISELHRGVTILNGEGGYTGDNINVLLTAVSKYEVHHLNRIIMEADPHAFIMYNEDISIRGNFEKRLN